MSLVAPAEKPSIPSRRFNPQILPELPSRPIKIDREDTIAPDRDTALL